MKNLKNLKKFKKKKKNSLNSLFTENIHWRHWVHELSVICQVSKSQTSQLLRRLIKKWAWHNEVQTLWGQIWPQIWMSSKPLKKMFYYDFGVFRWMSKLTSKLTSLCMSLIMSRFFFSNLLHSPGVWIFDTWQITDNSCTQCLQWIFSVNSEFSE